MFRVSNGLIKQGRWVGQNKYPGLTPESAYRQLKNIQPGERVSTKLAEIVVLSLPDNKTITLPDGQVVDRKQLLHDLTVARTCFHLVKVRNGTFDIGQNSIEDASNLRVLDAWCVPFYEKVVPKSLDDLQAAFDQIPNKGTVKIFDSRGAQDRISKQVLEILLFTSDGPITTAFLGSDDNWYVKSTRQGQTCTIQDIEWAKDLGKLLKEHERK